MMKRFNLNKEKIARLKNAHTIKGGHEDVSTLSLEECDENGNCTIVGNTNGTIGGGIEPTNPGANLGDG